MNRTDEEAPLSAQDTTLVDTPLDEPVDLDGERAQAREADGGAVGDDEDDTDTAGKAPHVDVVEVDVTESEDASHHAPQLVEGDFFPSESPAEAVELAAEEEGDEELRALVVEASAASAGNAPPPAVISKDLAAPAKRRRVQWADAVVHHAEQRRSLIRHVTSFYMPQSAHRDLDLHGQRHLHGFGGTSTGAADSALFPEPVAPSAAAVALFKERQNANGEPYLFCRAQRVAPRFVEWKRGSHAPFEVPFLRQPGAPPEDDEAGPTTLFAALYPAPEAVATAASARSHVAVMNIHNNYQMPFMRPDQLFDEPLTFAQ